LMSRLSGNVVASTSWNPDTPNHWYGEESGVGLLGYYVTSLTSCWC